MSEKIVFEGVVEYSEEDGGCALVSENLVETGVINPETGMFVRLQSWDDDPIREGRHTLARTLENKKVRITVEVLDED